MLLEKKIIIVLPAYNAEKTLEQTIDDIDKTIVDQIILVDDYSNDGTVELSKKLNLITIKHNKNLGYGGNQKTCYNKALELGADIVIMLHPDYQYTPKLIPAMAGMIASDVYDVVIASRILGGQALKGGMPLYKYFFNRFLTFVENLFTGLKLSETHSGYRAYTKDFLLQSNYQSFNDDFAFDNQILIKSCFLNCRIGEISCPTKYFKDSSSISFYNSIFYGLNCIKYGLLFFLAKRKIYTNKFFKK